jgi:hypothetical protein
MSYPSLTVSDGHGMRVSVGVFPRSHGFFTRTRSPSIGVL